MKELDTTADLDTDHFVDELSDEALDRAEAVNGASLVTSHTRSS